MLGEALVAQGEVATGIRITGTPVMLMRGLVSTAAVFVLTIAVL